MVEIAGFQKNISKMRYPYTYAQAHCTIWADLLDAEIQYGNASYTAKKVYFYLGSDYAGEKMFNLFGGVPEGVYHRMKHFVNHEAEYFSLGFDIPDFGAAIKKRLHNKSCYDGFTEEFCDEISEKCLKVKTIIPEDLVKDTILFGDSHSLSIVDYKTPVVKIIGKTLHGALKDNFLRTLADETKAKHVQFMFGSIDIRHHLYRQKDPQKSLDILIETYYEQVKEISKTKEVTICSPVPTEHEERKLPKTGYFEGTPFMGSRDDRVTSTLYFITKMKRLTENDKNISVKTYPLEWYYLDGEIYAKTIMERPTNTHVSLPYSKSRDFGKTEIKEW